MVDIAAIGVMLFLIVCWKKAARNVTPSLPSEHDEQAGFVQWFRAKWPRVMIFAIPNGGKRDIKTAKRLHRERKGQGNKKYLYTRLGERENILLYTCRGDQTENQRNSN